MITLVQCICRVCIACQVLWFLCLSLVCDSIHSCVSVPFPAQLIWSGKIQEENWALLRAASCLREERRRRHEEAMEAEECEELKCRESSLEVVEQGWSGWLVHLFLEDGELARVAVSCHLA